MAATVQLLTAAATWQTLRDYWDMDGEEAAETAALALGLVFEGARQGRERRIHMPPVAGVNHVAVLTDDLDRFVEFYTDVFDLEMVFCETRPAFRHAILRTGADSWLHPAQVFGNPHGAGAPDMFDRGHLDHLALTVASPEAFDILRQRLAERGSSHGAVEDLGAFQTIWFEDPDGMRVELTAIVDPELRHIHAPRRLAS